MLMVQIEHGILVEIWLPVRFLTLPKSEFDS